MKLAEFTKAITAAISAAAAVEASGAVTGVADHYLSVGITAAVALVGAFGIVYIVPNKPPAAKAADVSAVTSDQFNAL